MEKEKEKEKTYPRLVIKKSVWKYGSHPWRVFKATTNRWTALLGRFASYTEALEFANAEIRYFNDDSRDAGW